MERITKLVTNKFIETWITDNPVKKMVHIVSVMPTGKVSLYAIFRFRLATDVNAHEMLPMTMAYCGSNNDQHANSQLHSDAFPKNTDELHIYTNRWTVVISRIAVTDGNEIKCIW